MASHCAWIVLPALLASLAFLTIPRRSPSLDDSFAYEAVLNFAHEHTLQFGKDLLFTYGPLGFLSNRSFFPAGPGLIVTLLWCFIVALGLRLIARRLKWPVSVGLWSVFLFVACNIDPRVDLLLYLGLFCWAMLCLALEGWRLYFSSFILGIFCAFTVLVKGSFLMIGGLTGVMVMLDMVLRKQWKPALLLVVVLPVSFLFGWIALGQRIENVQPFLAGIVWFVDGYDQALGLGGMALFKVRSELSLGLALVVIMAWGSTAAISRMRALLLVFWVSLTTWLVWKHAFVRSDFYHVSIFLGFVSLLPLLLSILPLLDVPLKRWGLIAGVACCLVPIYTLQSLNFPELKYSLTQPFRATAQNVRSLLFSEAYRADRRKEMDLASSKVALPLVRHTAGAATIDVFGQNQAHAVLNALNYQPRPVFQSYAAYNRKLMGVNEQFYSSTAAPDYVLFDLDPIDHKFPPLEDAFVLRDLLFNYGLVEQEKNFLLLKRKSTERPLLTFLRAGGISTDGKIALETLGTTNLWLEILVRPTISGRAEQFLCKLSKPRIKVWLEGRAKPLVFPAPAPMLGAGFLASPLLLNNRDLERYCRGGGATRPIAYGIELPAEDAGRWNVRVDFRLFAIDPSGQ